MPSDESVPVAVMTDAARAEPETTLTHTYRFHPMPDLLVVHGIDQGVPGELRLAEIATVLWSDNDRPLAGIHFSTHRSPFDEVDGRTSWPSPGRTPPGAEGSSMAQLQYARPTQAEADPAGRHASWPTVRSSRDARRRGLIRADQAMVGTVGVHTWLDHAVVDRAPPVVPAIGDIRANRATERPIASVPVSRSWRLSTHSLSDSATSTKHHPLQSADTDQLCG